MVKCFSIEGIDGSGKTTVLNKIKEFLKEKNIDFTVSREPGGEPIAEEIRNILLNNKNTNMDYRTETLLFAASRAQHLKEKVLPLIEQGKLVILDRYIHSSLAYQGYARGVGIKKVLEINKFATNGFIPDFVLYIDLAPETAAERTKNRKYNNRLDKESIEFYKKVREGYLKLFEMFPEQMVLIDGSKTPEEVFRQVKKVLIEKLNLK